MVSWEVRFRILRHLHISFLQSYKNTYHLNLSYTLLELGKEAIKFKNK